MHPILIAAILGVAAFVFIRWANLFFENMNEALKKEQQDNQEEYYLHKTFAEIDGLRKSLRYVEEDPLDSTCIGPGIYDDIDPEDVMAFAKKNGIDPMYENFKLASTAAPPSV